MTPHPTDEFRRGASKIQFWSELLGYALVLALGFIVLVITT